MATPPTVLASASAVAPSAAPSAPAPVKFPVVPLLIAVVSGALIATGGLGGVVYYMARSGRLPLQRTAAAKTEPAGPTSTHAIVLEPLLVNLADADGNAYLRVSMTLRVYDNAEKKSSAAKEKAGDGGDAAVAAVRDTALTVLGRQSSDGLLVVDGKERLKAELKRAFAEHNQDLKVADVFFTDFLVQR